ncbi:MAG: hypothetical protein SGARI_001110, partial [Bacillariaceae sp.]
MKSKKTKTKTEEEKDHSDDDSSSSHEEEEEEEHSNGGDDHEDGDEVSDDDDAQDEELLQAKRPKKIHKLSLTETENFNEKLKKRGVIYIARIPPKMTPTKVKALLQEFGEVTRVYLVEEDASVRKRRRKELGRSGGKRYREGWIEFADKKKAKHIASSLNTTPISNHKRNPHYGDLWNLKYLSKFKWSHLTEKVAYERRVREQKLRVEMMQAKRENAAYAEMVEMGKKLDKIEERKRRRGDLSGVEYDD